MSQAEQPPHIDELLAQAGWARRLARALVRDEFQADDVLQIAWMAAIKSAPADRSRLRGWLAQIIRNAAAQLARSDRRWHAHATADAARADATVPDASTVSSLVESQRLLLRAVNELGELERTVIVHRYFQRLPPRVIAARLGVSTNVVKARLRRGKQHLREILAREGLEGDDRLRLAFGPLLLDHAGVKHPAGPRKGSSEPLPKRSGLQWKLVGVAVAVVGAVALVASLTKPQSSSDLGLSSSRSDASTAESSAHRRARAAAASDKGTASAATAPDPQAPLGAHTVVRVTLDAAMPSDVRVLRVRELRSDPVTVGPWSEVAVIESEALLHLAPEHGSSGRVVAVEISADHPRLSRSPVRIARGELAGGNLRLRVPDAVPVRGSVSFADGVHHQDAMVTAFPVSDALQLYPEDSAPLDLDGRFELRLQRGTEYHVVAVARDLRPAGCRVVAAETSQPIGLECGVGVEVRGTVSVPGCNLPTKVMHVSASREGASPTLALPDASLIGIFGAEYAWARVTSGALERGQFRIAGLSTAPHGVAAQISDIAIIGDCGAAAAWEPTGDDLDLTVSGELLEIRGPGVREGAMVVFECDGAHCPAAGRVGDDACLVIAPPRAAVVATVGIGPLAFSAERPRGDTARSITLSQAPTSMVTATAILTSKSSDAPQRITLDLQTGPWRRRVPEYTVSASLISGRAQFKVPALGPATLTLRAQVNAPDGPNWWVPIESSVDTSAPLDLNGELVEGGRLTIVFRDRSGRPRTGRIALHGPSGAVSVWCQIRRPAAATAVADGLCPSGVTDLADPLPPGEYRVVITTAGGEGFECPVSIVAREASLVVVDGR